MSNSRLILNLKILNPILDNLNLRKTEILTITEIDFYILYGKCYVPI